MSDSQRLMTEIIEVQENIVRQRQERTELEARMKGLDEQIDADLACLADLQEQLNRAISDATHRAVEG